jgi:hypothetical protein
LFSVWKKLFAVKSLTLSVAGSNVHILEMVVICTETDGNVGLKYMSIPWFMHLILTARLQQESI